MDTRILISEISRKSKGVGEIPVTQSQVRYVIESISEIFVKSLKMNGKSILKGIGSFVVKTRRERKIPHPKTKIISVHPERKIVKFTASSKISCIGKKNE